jgi:hypothetical protein
MMKATFMPPTKLILGFLKNSIVLSDLSRTLEVRIDALQYRAEWEPPSRAD